MASYSSIFNFNSIKTRVTIFTLGIFVIGIWLLYFLMSHQLHEGMQKQLANQQASIASILATQVDQELRERLSVLENISEKIAPISLVDDKLIQTTLQQQILMPSLFNAGVYVVNAEGVAVASIHSSVRRVGVNYMDRDYIVAALKEGQTTITKPVIGKVLGTPIFNIVIPVRDAQGTVVAALVGVRSW